MLRLSELYVVFDVVVDLILKCLAQSERCAANYPRAIQPEGPAFYHLLVKAHAVFIEIFIRTDVFDS